MFKFLTAIILVLSTALLLVSYNKESISFENLSTEEMHETIITQRNHAIQKAKAEGNYRCCIEPPCTMCYMEANEWNNHTAGTCACDDLVAEGKEPCPQCKRGSCSEEPGNTCSVIN